MRRRHRVLRRHRGARRSSGQPLHRSIRTAERRPALALASPSEAPCLAYESPLLLDALRAGEQRSCNWVGAGTSLTSGGPHGVCALGAGNAEIGDIGFCSQECDTVADCSDKTDMGGMSD